MRRTGSSRLTGAVLLVVGLLIGAGIMFAATYAYGGAQTKTITASGSVTVVSTTIAISTTTAVRTTTYVSTTTAFSTVTSSSGVSARVQASVISCTWNGTSEQCQLVLTNSGNADTATVGVCSMTFGTGTFGGYTAATAAAAVRPGPQTVSSGASVTTYCVAGTTQPAAGIPISGVVSLINGGMALFTATA